MEKMEAHLEYSNSQWVRFGMRHTNAFTQIHTHTHSMKIFLPVAWTPSNIHHPTHQQMSSRLADFWSILSAMSTSGQIGIYTEVILKGVNSAPSSTTVVIRSDSSSPRTDFISLFRLESGTIWTTTAPLKLRSESFPYSNCRASSQKDAFCGKITSSTIFCADRKTG